MTHATFQVGDLTARVLPPLASVPHKDPRAPQNLVPIGRFADLTAGKSDASDLIYNQSCTEALNQSPQPSYTGPDVCVTKGKDGYFYVLQATAPSGQVVATLVSYAAHGTIGFGISHAAGGATSPRHPSPQVFTPLTR